MPTKTEQSDLFQAVYGRNADSPLPVIAAATPADCFDVAIEAVRLAVTYMTPVILLTDGFLANAAEPWLIPDARSLPRFPARFRTDPSGFHPFVRDEKSLARAWAVPGTPGLEHRIGGIERAFGSGHISYDPDNHQKMTDTRFAKVAGIANDIPLQAVALGGTRGPLAVVGWGSTFGAIHAGVQAARAEGLDVAHIHIRHLHPFPRNLGELLGGYRNVLVPEMNNGQLVTMLRSTYLVPALKLSKVTGKPFKAAEILSAIRARLES
jgi:2-oxoglutarate ferredoxin oxidoreductase subunit alpha